MLRRVLIAHSSDEMYGADFILLRTARALRRRGVAVRVIVPADIGGHRPLSAALRELGCEVEVHELAVLRRKYFSPRALPGLILRWVREVARLRALLRRERPDVMYSNTLAVTAPAVAAAWSGVPHLWHVHEIVEHPRWFGYILARLARKFSNRVVAVSNAVNEFLERSAPGVPSVVVRNGVPDPMADVDRLSARRRANEQLGISDEVPLVLMIGRLSEWKGGPVLARAALEHVRAGGSAHFAIVGGDVPGERGIRSELEQLASTPAMKGRLHLVDFTTDVTPFLARASIFALPSIRPDPYPTVVLEAMYAGLPIVTFAHGGVLEMISASQAGIAVPVADAGKLRAAIEDLLAEPSVASAIGQRGREHAVREFAPSVFETRFLRQLCEAATLTLVDGGSANVESGIPCLAQHEVPE
jgi:glycosyltransferase involved in cell wall biosynthesis